MPSKVIGYASFIVMLSVLRELSWTFIFHMQWSVFELCLKLLVQFCTDSLEFMLPRAPSKLEKCTFRLIWFQSNSKSWMCPVFLIGILLSALYTKAGNLDSGGSNGFLSDKQGGENGLVRKTSLVKWTQANYLAKPQAYEFF